MKLTIFYSLVILSLTTTLHADNNSLLGLDKDKNGIRDDIQRWIATKYKNSPELLHTFNQYALSIQNTMSKKDNRTESNISHHKTLDTQRCLMSLLKKSGLEFASAVGATEEVRALFTNTKERILAFEKIDENFHGQSREWSSNTEVCSVK